MYDSFLHDIAKLYYNNTIEDNLKPADILFVFPNRRAGLFFRKEYCALASHAVFAPNTTDINRLCEMLTPLKLCNEIEQLVKLYKSYRFVSSSNRLSTAITSFDAFIGLGNTLLSDFNDIDKYLVQAEMLYKNIDALKQLTVDMNYFSGDQKKAIEQAFWQKVFINTEDDGLKFQNQFISLWSLQFPIYRHFRKQLLQEGIGYQGMLYRDVVENRLTSDDITIHYKRLVFIGFNMLTASEEAIFRYFQKRDMADFYFDYPQQYAGNSPFSDTVAYMYSDNLTKFPSKYEYIQPTAKKCGDIVIYGSPSISEQSDIAAKQIHKIYVENGRDMEKTINSTVVIPADESMLPYLLQSLPPYIEHLNVTMGYPLTQSPISNLIDNIISLHTEKKSVNTFYYKPIINILTHPYIQRNHHVLSTKLLGYITGNNFVRISQSDINAYIDSVRNDNNGISDEVAFFKRLLTTQTSVAGLFGYIHSILDLFLTQYDKLDDTTMYRFEIEYIVQYKQYVAQLEHILSDVVDDIGMTTLHSLIRRLTSNLKVQFKGEPLNGFQIMGMLESRLIDFDNIIILGFNDINIPGVKISQSLIPYTLRRSYDLPTYEHSDKIYAYNFYRMLYRAKHVTLTYNSRDNDSNNEISRYYHQIRHLLPMVVNDIKVTVNKKHHIAVMPLQSVGNEIEIIKTPDIMSVLDRYKKTESLSASALKNYIACPLKFYFNSITKIKQANEIDETNNAPILGLIFHKAMEIYYNEHTNGIHGATNKEMAEGLVQRAFAAIRATEKKGLEIAGFNRLIFNIVCDFILLTLNYDKQRKPFENVLSEKKIQTKSENGINFTAILDRIDTTIEDGIINIIDYKTTKSDQTSYTCKLLNLFNSPNKTDQEVFQILLYCHIYSTCHNVPANRLRPNIYNIYDISQKANNVNNESAFEHTHITVKVPKSLSDALSDDDITIDYESLHNEKETVSIDIYNYESIRIPFEIMLRHLIAEIFNPTVPFKANPDDRQHKSCQYCPYTRICRKEKDLKF
ncbi:MAG: PD-(D/E)XK nuclease family protein [Candidatus Aphodosoma sp.]